MLSGVIFFVCSTSWISRCFPVAISFSLKSQTTRRRELRKERREKGLWWRNQGQWVWYKEVWARINFPCWIRVHHTARGIADWVGILISQALTNQGETEAKTQRQVLECDTEMTILFPSTERSGREVNQRSSTGKPRREVQNQLKEVNLFHHNLDISNTRHIEKVFANVRQSWIVQKTTRYCWTKK